MSGDFLVVSGVVTNSAHELYHVECDFGETRRTIIARRNGQMNRNRIRVLVGDRVTLELSPLDPTRGRIIGRGDWTPKRCRA